MPRSEKIEATWVDATFAIGRVEHIATADRFGNITQSLRRGVESNFGSVWEREDGEDIGDYR